jgi:formiminotetrahydrofolate cyclodeaminase
MNLLDLSLRAFLDEVATDGRTPGGGSLAALVTAAGAGLLAKVARSSRNQWAEAAGVTAQAEALRDRAAPLAQLDADQYEEALRSLDGNGETAGERRDFEVGRAHARAAEPPLQIVETATDVARLSVLVGRNCDPALRADAAAAGALAAAAARAAAELIAVNLTFSAEDERVVRARALAKDAADAADEVFAGGT